MKNANIRAYDVAQNRMASSLSDMQELQELMFSVTTIRNKDRPEGLAAVITETDFSSSISNNIWGKNYPNMQVILPSNSKLSSRNSLNYTVFFPSKITITQPSRNTLVGYMMTTSMNSLWDSSFEDSISNFTSLNKVFTIRKHNNYFRVYIECEFN